MNGDVEKMIAASRIGFAGERPCLHASSSDITSSLRSAKHAKIVGPAIANALNAPRRCESRSNAHRHTMPDGPHL